MRSLEGSMIVHLVAIACASLGCQGFLVFDRSAAGEDAAADAAQTPDPGRSGSDAGATSAYAAAVLADGPIAYYRLGERDGNIVFDSVGTNHASCVGCALGAPGASDDGDTAASLDGSAWIAARPIRFTGRQPFTIEAWIRVDDGSIGQRRIASCATNVHGYSFFVYGGGELVIERFAPVYGPQTAWSVFGVVTRGVFHHVAAVYNGTELIVYRDGSELVRGISVLELADYDAPFVIGAYNPSLTKDQLFEGTIDEVAVYDKALSGDTIRSRFALLSPPPRR